MWRIVQASHSSVRVCAARIDVALVLAVLAVGDQHRAALAQRGEGLLDGGQADHAETSVSSGAGSRSSREALSHTKNP